MARHLTKPTRLVALLGMTLLSVAGARAADTQADDSISAQADARNSSVEISTRSYRPRPLSAGASVVRPAATPIVGQRKSSVPAGTSAKRNAAMRQSPQMVGETQADFQEPAPAEPSDEPVVTVNDDGSPDSILKPLSPSEGTLNLGVPCPTCGNAESNCDSCCCCVCGPPGRFWVRDEYLGFWGKSDHLPPLVNTGVIPGAPSTITLFGDQNVNSGFRSGNWLQGGMWLDSCKSVGIMGDYLFLGRQSTSFYDSSNGNPVLSRPFTNALTGAPGGELISYPGLLTGNVAVSDYNSFSGAGLAGIRELICKQCCGPCGADSCYQNCCRLDAIGGFRYYQFNDNLNITENLTSTSAAVGVPAGTTIRISDTFRTTNSFYGLELGLRGQRYYGRWLLEGTSAVALGDNSRQVYINGTTTVAYPGLPAVTSPGGLLALSSNNGSYRSQNFMAIPQFSGRVGYRVTPRLSLLAGYTFIFWGGVAKAADQIDMTVNPNLLPPSIPGGPARPAYHLAESNFWVQGFTLGAQYNF